MYLHCIDRKKCAKFASFVNKQYFKRVFIFSATLLIFRIISINTMFYFLNFDSLLNVRTTRNYANVENEKKRRRIEIKLAFIIMIDKNINILNNNFGSLHDFNFSSSNSDLFHEFLFTKDHYLQNVTFIVNDRSSSKTNFKYRFVEITNTFSTKTSNISIRFFIC